jgi:hypothetical protein
MHTQQRLPWLGIGLIAVGVFLLLKQIGVFRVYWYDILWVVLSVGGVLLIVRGLVQHGRGVFLGVCLAAIGGYKLMLAYTDFYIPSYLIFPSLLILAGVGVLLVYVARPRDWHLLIPSVLLLGLGGLMIMAEEGYFSRWELVDFLRTWWPAALVLFGTGLLLNRRRDHHT